MLRRVKRLYTRDTNMYNGIFAYGALKSFGKNRDLWPSNIVVLLLHDIYPLFGLNESRIWNVTINKVDFMRLRIKLVDLGYLARPDRGKYVVTIKGKQFIREFNEYYDELAKNALKSIGKR